MNIYISKNKYTEIPVEENITGKKTANDMSHVMLERGQAVAPNEIQGRSQVRMAVQPDIRGCQEAANHRLDA